MKFFQVLGYAALALALPNPAPLDDKSVVLKERATVTSALDSALTNLQGAVTSDLAAIQSAAAQIKGSTDIAIILKATAIINANFAAIVSALQAATSSILAGTLGAAGGLIGSITSITQQEVNTIISDLQKILTLLQNIRATVQLTATNLGPVVLNTVRAEILAAQAAVQPLLLPLLLLADTLGTTEIKAGLTVTGLEAAASGLFAIGQQFVTGLI